MSRRPQIDLEYRFRAVHNHAAFRHKVSRLETSGSLLKMTCLVGAIFPQSGSNGLMRVEVAIVGNVAKIWGRTMKRLIGVIILACLLYLGYAVYSIREIVQGFAVGDSESISAHIDFPSVRSSLKEQVAAVATAKAISAAGPIGSDRANAAAGLIAAVRPAIIDNMIDSLVTPAGVANLVTARRGGAAKEQLHFDFQSFLERLSISSPIKVRVSEEDGTQLVMSFTDWTWKIADLRVAPEKLRQLSP
jgi:hypothetical protein